MYAFCIVLFCTFRNAVILPAEALLLFAGEMDRKTPAGRHRGKNGAKMQGVTLCNAV